MFRVTSDERDAAPWICFLEMANQNYPAYKKAKRMLVCSKHFKKEDLRVSATERRNVNKGRFPSLHKNVDLSTEVTSYLHESIFN